MIPKEELLSAVRKVELFAALDEQLLENLYSSSVLKHFVSGDTLIRQGDKESIGLYVIIRGRVAVVSERDGSTAKIAELAEGQSFGETRMFTGEPPSATVSALEDTDCLTWTQEHISDLIKANPALAIELLRALAWRLRIVAERLGASPTPLPPPAPAASPPVPHTPPAETAASPAADSRTGSEQVQFSVCHPGAIAPTGWLRSHSGLARTRGTRH
jgi:CRP-like cAMP-binding protein